MNLTLALPALNCQTPSSLPPLALPALDQLLRFGRFTPQPAAASAFYARYLWQGSLLALARQQAGLAAAQPAVFAAPVWQQMGMNHMDMISASDIGIQAPDAERLCQGLNAFYQDEGWHFQALRPDLWLVSLPETPDWQVPPLPDALGAADGSLRAEGRDSRQWLQKQTEIQMWLHQHAADGTTGANTPSVNGIWLWQDLAGSQTAAPLLASDSPWAQFYPGKKFDAPHDFSAWQRLLAEQPPAETASPQDGLLFLDDLVACSHSGDIGAYVHTLQSLETRWFAPLWQALRTGRLNSLCISTDGADGGELRIKSGAQRAFWKRKRAFQGLLGGKSAVKQTRMPAE
ncbi:MAG: hypothetical protein Q4G28_00300 [Neisseria sp.]|nr:hypothetical protein [Neisseria sp.]